MKIFLDTNILLDLILDREGRDDVLRIIDWSRKDPWTRIYTSVLAVADLAYVSRKNGTKRVKSAISDIMQWCNILTMNDMTIYHAVRNSSPDFEDSMQLSCAETAGCDIILTRNEKHFRQFTEIPVLSPREFIGRCGMQDND